MGRCSGTMLGTVGRCGGTMLGTVGRCGGTMLGTVGRCIDTRSKGCYIRCCGMRLMLVRVIGSCL